MAALSGAALGVAAPAAAQTGAPGPVYYQSAPIPAPGGAIYARPPMVAVDAPPPVAAPHPTYVTREQRGNRGPAVPTAAPRVWQNGRWVALPPSQNIVRQSHTDRWGYERDGRWSGGSRAPGGWNAYRRLDRGHRMPQYWLGGAFGISDYLNYGLAAPPRGYRWLRYYDDAVLVDQQGGVWDSVGGIAWTGAQAGGYSSSDSYSYSSSGADYGPPIQQIDPNAYYGQQQYYQGGYAPQPAPYGYSAAYGSSYQAGSYYYGAPTSTTVVVIPTTTTTTVVEETIETVATRSYVRAAPRRVVRRAPVKRPRAKVVCCVCVCR